MKKIFLLLTLTACVAPAPEPVEQISNKIIEKKAITCPAGELSYPDKNGNHQHAIQPGPNRAALIKCTCENN
jgi:hypothetical protein